MAGNRARYSVMLLLLSQGWTPKRSLHVSTARNGGDPELETAGRPLSPAFSTIRRGGGVAPLSVEFPPPNTPTAVCMVLYAREITSGFNVKQQVEYLGTSDYWHDNKAFQRVSQSKIYVPM